MSLLLMGEVAEAFKPVTFVGKAAPALRNSQAWGAPMKTMMVAGGAERSQGDDYYEGKLCMSTFNGTGTCRRMDLGNLRRRALILVT